MADFGKSFLDWWEATKKVAGAAVDTATSAITGDTEAERVRMIMALRQCDEPTARALYAQWLAEQETKADGKGLDRQSDKQE